MPCHAYIWQTLSCVKCHAPIFLVLNVMNFPLETYLVERGQTYIYIQNSITGPCLKIYHSWYINSPRHVFILYTAMPITCYIQFLSLCPWKVRKSFISKCIYDKSLTRKLAIWQIIFSPCVQYCNGVSAFTMYICTILHFPVHLKLDFQIFSFFFNLNIAIFAVWHFLPWPVSNWTFRFFYCAFFPCTYAFLRGRHLAQSVSNWTFWFFQSCIFPLHICLFTR